jgi:hypothetical protein
MTKSLPLQGVHSSLGVYIGKEQRQESGANVAGSLCQVVKWMITILGSITWSLIGDKRLLLLGGSFNSCHKMFIAQTCVLGIQGDCRKE